MMRGRPATERLVSSARFLRAVPWASAARRAGSPSPAMRAASIARPLAPRTSERTLATLMFASSRTFWIRSECWEISRTSCSRVRVRSRSSWMGVGGTKLLRISPCASRSASQIASFVSLRDPAHCERVGALAKTSAKPSSSRCHTGFQSRACSRGRPASRRGRAVRSWSSRSDVPLDASAERRSGHRPLRCPCGRRAPRTGDRGLPGSSFVGLWRREELSSAKSTSRARESRDSWPKFGVLAGLWVQLLNGLVAPCQGRPRSRRRPPSYLRNRPPCVGATGFIHRGRSRPMGDY